MIHWHMNISFVEGDIIMDSSANRTRVNHYPGLKTVELSQTQLEKVLVDIATQYLLQTHL